MAVLILRNAAEKDALVRPKQIHGGKNNAQSRPGRPRRMLLKRSRENQELADKAIEHRQPRRSEAHEQIESREHGHRRGEAAEFLNQVSMAAVVEHPDAQEQRAGRDAVAQHLVNSALDRDGMKREDPENDESEMADGGVGAQAFQV